MSVYDDLCDEDSIFAFVDNVSKKYLQVLVLCIRRLLK